MRNGRCFCSHSDDCIGILNLSDFYLPNTSFGDDRAIQNAIDKIKNCLDFFASECIDLIRKAADWSISFAEGSDARKSAFLKDVSQGKDREMAKKKRAVCLRCTTSNWPPACAGENCLA